MERINIPRNLNEKEKIRITGNVFIKSRNIPYILSAGLGGYKLYNILQLPLQFSQYRIFIPIVSCGLGFLLSELKLHNYHIEKSLMNYVSFNIDKFKIRRYKNESCSKNRIFKLRLQKSKQ